jgi:ATP-dependent Lon protease
LREQIKAIQSELGEKDGILSEVEEYREKVNKLSLPEEIKIKAEKEIDRLSKMQSGFAESSVIRNYLDWIIDLPWSEKTEESLDLDRAEKILDEDHYGLEKVKERILEYLAIRIYKNSIKGPILCLVGPPGVGKTSIAKSVARALNRKYVRMSLGGVRDEAEIRGHRRTYVGAIPGRVIYALKQAGTKNPLMLLDEIDKMSSDFRGDPASAMLEVLDGEQNFAFRDHYMELPFDLSDVLFITTANTADTIPKPLLDRMETIYISGYTEEEKTQIALGFLAPKQLVMHGLPKKNVRFDEQAVKDIINYYTKESGVRNLEREIAGICRKIVKEMVSSGRKSYKVTKSVVAKLLGAKKYRYEMIGERDEVGVAKGLAWTPVGGDTLNVEVSLMNGTGKLELTGQLGDVMKESAKTALSYIRSRAGVLDIDAAFHSKHDIHIHVPEGAIPKDGPSAGITVAASMASALTGCPVRKNVAMTGEITLRGRVLPVGGLKEKVLAARRAGIDTVIYPLENKKDIDEIPLNVKEGIKFLPVTNMDEVLRAAMRKQPVKLDILRDDSDGGILLNNVKNVVKNVEQIKDERVEH